MAAEIAILVFSASWKVMLCLIPFIWFLLHRLYRRLETAHYLVWFDLGQPTFPGRVPQRRVKRWLKENYASVDDPMLEGIYTKLQAVERVARVVCLLGVIAVALVVTSAYI